MITGQDLNGVKDEAVRRYKDLDLIFVNEVLEPLNQAYYQSWKLGGEEKWMGFKPSPQDSLEERALLFQALHNLCWSAYEVVKKLLCEELGITYEEWEVSDPDYDEDVDPVRPLDLSLLELSKRNIRRIRDIQNINIDQIKNFVENQFGIVFSVDD
jgi:hypothetical protein